MSTLTIGVFTDRAEANRSLDRLLRQGYAAKDISIIMRDSDMHTEVVKSKGDNVAEGTISGATTGGVLGALAGLLIGVGAIAVPGIGALLIGGPVAAALGLTGAAATTTAGAVTGAVAGGLVGGLVGLGVPEQQAQVYEDVVREGGVLVAVVTPEEDANVRDTLSEDAAQSVQSYVFAG